MRGIIRYFLKTISSPLSSRDRFSPPWMTKRILSRVQWREIARRKSRRVYRRLTRRCCNVRCTLRLSGIKRTREIATSARRQWYVRVSANQFLQFTPVRLFVTGYTAGYLAKLSVIANLPPISLNRPFPFTLPAIVIIAYRKVIIMVIDDCRAKDWD